MLNLLPRIPVRVACWRRFKTITSDAEALLFSQNCLFSLATLEVDRDPETNNFALTEQEQPNVWRWALVSDEGEVIQTGNEPTQVAAQRVASDALYWGPLLKLAD